MKYHYVVFGYTRDYFQVMFEDAVKMRDVEYISHPIKQGGYNRLLCLLYNIHHNTYINWRWNLPLKQLWYPLYYRKTVEAPICFIFLMSWCHPMYKPLFLLLKKRYPNSVLVLYLEDIVSSREKFYFDELANFDMVVSYDKADAEKYGFLYYPTFMSKISVSPEKNKRTDVCFWGVEKNRINHINGVYRYLTSNGLKCDFLVTKPKDKRKLVKGIKVRKHDKSYRSYLQAVANSRCILEIMQNSAVGYTLRTWEALLYNKILITNNKSIMGAPFYSPERIIVFDKPDDINIEALFGELLENSSLTQTISPVRFIDYLESFLS